MAYHRGLSAFLEHTGLDIKDLVTRLNAYYDMGSVEVAEILTNEFRDRGRLLRIAELSPGRGEKSSATFAAR
jgi:hypothetical protein